MDTEETVVNLGTALAERFAAAAKSAGELVSHFREGKLSLASLSDVVAFHLPLDLELKLKLLEQANPVQRARWRLDALDASAGPKCDDPERTKSPLQSKFPPDFGQN